MSKLTVLAIRNAKVTGKGYKLQDGKGLHLYISKTGHKSWRYRFRFEGKESVFTLGEYPIMGLSDARAELTTCKAMVRQGVNPVVARQKNKIQVVESAKAEKVAIENTFERVGMEWLGLQKGRWSDDHASSVLRSLQCNAFPLLGALSVDEISPPMILEVIRTIEERGSLVIASKVLQRITAILRYAVQTGKATVNPATEMKGVVRTRKVQHQLSLTRKELPEFLQRLSEYKIHITTRLALQFTILTACRTGEVRGAKWNEIDTEGGLWQIPASRMKMRTPHTVPLSRQALAILLHVGQVWGNTGFIFPGVRQGTKQLSQDTMQKAVWSLGYKGRATVHGFRGTFSTITNESGFSPDVIEKSLAHQERNQVRGAYNHSEYLSQRAELMQWWADLLDQLENGADIIPFRATGL